MVQMPLFGWDSEGGRIASQALDELAVLLWSSPDSFDGVWELGRQIDVMLEEAALYFWC